MLALGNTLRTQSAQFSRWPWALDSTQGACLVSHQDRSAKSILKIDRQLGGNAKGLKLGFGKLMYSP